ncbi:MAG: hypothetical protein CMM58_02185 [Rhodospirillaceae bacterium]|nr:hypothetical protein [Rhodospirillaceae bacterium]|tara:strand:+ start:4414 stop:5523 length:1110 start_codon:yes stop_codon:yes gene_type:complete
MKIKSVKATPVRVPVTRLGVMSGAVRTHAERTIVQVVADNGKIGIGETRGVFSASIINDRFSNLLEGLPVESKIVARDKCIRKNLDYGFPEQLLELNAFAGVEMALWDLEGKEADLPLYQLLGGAVRAVAPFVAYAYNVDHRTGSSEAKIPEIMGALAEERVALTGASMFEFKIGVHSLACDIDTVMAVRESLSADVDIRIDANMGFDLRSASSLAEKISAANIANFEEPVAHLCEMAILRREYKIPISTHCTDFDALKPYPQIDSVVPDLHLLGGIAATKRFCAKACSFNRSVWLRSMWELGISWAAMCHLGIACPELERPAQSLIDWISDDLIIGDPWLVRNGGVCLPDLPGLGVQLDYNALRKFSV